MQHTAIIVGTGGIAGAHAEAYGAPQVAGRAKLVAAVDIDAERAARFAARYSLPASYTDLAAALEAERPRVVHLCTPPGVHADQSILSLEAGAWVLCEKPPCASLAELDRIEDAERRTGNRCAIVFQWRFGSGMRQVKRQIDSGALGRPLVGVCNTLWYRDTTYYAVPWRGKWKTELGGPTMGHGIHIMDSFLWLMGDWTEVTARVGTLERDIEVEDVSMAIVRFANGAMGSIVNSVLCPRQETYLRIDFQQATVEVTGLYSVSNDDWKWTARPAATDLGAAGALAGGVKQAADPAAQWSRIGEQVDASHTTQIAAFYDDLEQGRAPLTTGAETRRTMEFLTAVYKSAFTGRTVQAGSIVPGDPYYDVLNGRV